jgi:trigger factor
VSSDNTDADAVAVSDSDVENTDAVDEAQVDDALDVPWSMSLSVDVHDAGPCRKRIDVVIPEADIAHVRQQTLDEFADKANVPGFRVGRVPRGLVEAKFKRELVDELKQRILVTSLEQLTAEQELDPINEPDMDVDAIDIPDSGDFEYTFEVEVRPDVDLPDFSELTLKREVQEVNEEAIAKYQEQMLLEYGERVSQDGPAVAGDYITTSISFSHKDAVIREISKSLKLQPTLAFSDAEITGFDELIAGAATGDSRSIDITISDEAESIPMRGETVTATFTLEDVQKFVPAVIDKDLLNRIGVETESALKEEVENILNRQVTYRQRQSAREQLLEVITSSTEWDLPEELVMKQVDNAMHREILEMQQAGYTPKEIRARENDLRQRSVSVTRQAMKEHFVLDKIATEHEIEVSNEDLDMEIMMMAFQSGETPRRLRARLEKTGVIENLEAQIRERKAIDIALDAAKYDDVDSTEALVSDLGVEAIEEGICNSMLTRTAAVAATPEEPAAEEATAEASDSEEPAAE